MQRQRPALLHQQSTFIPYITSKSTGLLDLVLPPRCIVSGEVVGRPGEILPDAWAKLQFISSPHCATCGVPFAFEMEPDAVCAECLRVPPVFQQARAALVYDDVSRDLILRFKHADQTHMINSFLPWLDRAGEDFLARTDLVLPVPLHRWRLFRRRYNQAALIAKSLSRHRGIPWDGLALVRHKSTLPQGHKNAGDRHANVKNVFSVQDKRRPLVEARRVLLIDDVYTTGATVQECAKALLKAGAAEVNVLTLARVVRHR